MGGLPHDGEPAISDAIALIRSAVDAYEANVPEELNHPFVGSRPERAWLNAWLSLILAMATRSRTFTLKAG
jgi:hypothetical protein